MGRAAASAQERKGIKGSAAIFGRRANFTARPCRASLRDAVSLRQRLPRRAQKLRPPRNDKSDRFCWETRRFSERKVSNFCGATSRKKTGGRPCGRLPVFLSSAKLTCPYSSERRPRQRSPPASFRCPRPFQSERRRRTSRNRPAPWQRCSYTAQRSSSRP